MSAAEHIGIGATWYIAYRSQSGRFQTVSEAVTQDSNGAATVLITDYSYWNLRTLLKLGAAFEYKPWAFGLAVTTPSLDLFGSGSAFANLAVINIDPEGTGSPSSELGSTFQEGLSAHYRSPLSVAVGCPYSYRRAIFHFTAEWFDRVDRFEFMNVENFTVQTTGETVLVKFSHAPGRVFNFGFGLDRKFNNRFALYGGFITDRTAYTEGSDRLSISTWDIYHITVGSAFNIQGADITLGISYGFGSDTQDLGVNFECADESNDFIGREREFEISCDLIKIVFGFSFSI